MSAWDGRLKFFVSSADPDAAPVWVDFTSRVRDVEEVPELWSGRQDDVADTSPAQFTVLLDNSDGALTFGNTASPYASWWGPGRKCYLTERVTSAVTQDRFTGYIQMPEERIVTESVEARVFIAALDRLGRLGQGRPFVSTLGAHIIGSVRNNCLVGYWPLNDPGAPFGDAVGGQSATTLVNQSSSTNTDQKPEFLYAQGPSLPGDDVATLRLLQGLNGGSSSAAPSVDVTYPSFPTDLRFPLAAGQAVTAVAWMNQEAIDTFLGSSIALGVDVNLGGHTLSMFLSSDSLGAHWQELYTGTGDTLSADDGSANATGRWYAVAVRWARSPNAIEIWVDNRQYTKSFTQTITSAFTNGFTTTSPGSLAHLQMYVGAQADFTFADFTAQRAVGLTGLDRQVTGDRIRSILTYAGVPSSEWTTTVDAGSTVMQRARLAGKDPLTALQEPERTEQGLLYVDGSGIMHFADRHTLYGI